MDWIFLCLVIFLFVLAVSDLWVGVSNDAVNFLNSAIGSRAAGFRTIIVIAATNYKDQIEEAMLSRLGKQIYISLPDEKLRKSLIQSEIKKSNITKNISEENINELIELLDGFSSRDISKILKETINEHLTYSDTQLSIEDFKKEIEQFTRNRNTEKQSNKYINKLRTLINSFSETEAQDVMKLILELKMKNENKNSEGK